MLNGGVSLAVWMGGVALELDRLVKAGQGETTRRIRAMLRWPESTARVDVISGTSAGGVNGAALALAQVNGGPTWPPCATSGWTRAGSRRCCASRSAARRTRCYKGDEHFLPQLNAALTSLAVPPTWCRPGTPPSTSR